MADLMQQARELLADSIGTRIFRDDGLVPVGQAVDAIVRALQSSDEPSSREASSAD